MNEEEAKIYFEELERIAQKMYKKSYNSLCFARQRTVQTMLKAGDYQMKKRETNRYIKERRDSKGRLLCLVPNCNKLRQKYKTNNNIRNYCEDHKCYDMSEFINWSSLREKVLKRDNYT